jgi:hypothetical protein
MKKLGSGDALMTELNKNLEAKKMNVSTSVSDPVDDNEPQISWPVPRLALKCDTKTWGSASGLLRAMAADRTSRTAAQWAARSQAVQESWTGLGIRHEMQSRFCLRPSSDSVSRTEEVLRALAGLKVPASASSSLSKPAPSSRPIVTHDDGRYRLAEFRDQDRRGAMDNFFFSLARVAQGRFEHPNLHQNHRYKSALEVVVSHDKSEFITELEDLPDLNEIVPNLDVLMTPHPAGDEASEDGQCEVSTQRNITLFERQSCAIRGLGVLHLICCVSPGFLL